MTMTESDPTSSEPARVPEIRARVRIRYCTQCRWLMRAQWLAGELLTTFPLELEVTLEPGIGGVFDVLLDDQPLFSRAERRRFPEPKELKQKIRDAVAPGRSLGHSEASDASEPDA
jgi:selenoprotein W-related protein